MKSLCFNEPKYFQTPLDDLSLNAPITLYSELYSVMFTFSFTSISSITLSSIIQDRLSLFAASNDRRSYHNCRSSNFNLDEPMSVCPRRLEFYVFGLAVALENYFVSNLTLHENTFLLLFFSVDEPLLLCQLKVSKQIVLWFLTQMKFAFDHSFVREINECK